MSDWVKLKSGHDGFEVPAYHCKPLDARRGGLVVVQEIFGVNEHIREVAERFAADGYETLAPAFFERAKPGFEADYSPMGFGRGRDLVGKTPWDQVVGDLQAAIDALAPPVFVVGYCWGGVAAWLAACRCTGVAAASAYYGRMIVDLKDETPRAPIILHYGKTDAHIPPDNYEAVAAAHPDVPIYLYDAGHGFNCDKRDDYAADPARLARLRTLQLFQRSGGSKGEV
jgi:carboxymethylenebutenolidase